MKQIPPSMLTPDKFAKYLFTLASVRITVVALTMGLFLVFVGTLAQTRLGVWVVINDYFRSWHVSVPVNIFPDLIVPDDKWRYDRGYFFPMPGGFSILMVLSVNMLAAMLKLIVRDLKIGNKRWRRNIGIYAIHLGLIVMFAGEFVTGLYAIEGQMTVKRGESTNFVEDTRVTELAFVLDSEGSRIQGVTIPQTILVDYGAKIGEHKVIDHPDLPVLVRVERYMANTGHRMSPVPTDFEGAGRSVEVKEIPTVPAINNEAVDIPSVQVTLIDRDSGEPLGLWLCSAISQANGLATYSGNPMPGIFAPQPFTAPEQAASWTVHLRYARRHLPYRVGLVGLDHDVYEGTQMARNFSSDVLVVDARSEAERSEHIKMNHPMRHKGDTFYQHQMMAGLDVSVFQVVYNPGSWMPYISCAIVSLGLALQFMMSLTRFTRRVRR